MSKKRGYFSLREAWDDVAMSYGAKEKAVSSSKLVGKLAWNVVRTIPSIGLSALKVQADNTVSDPNTTKEQKESAKRMQEKYEKYKDIV